VVHRRVPLLVDVPVAAARRYSRVVMKKLGRDECLPDVGGCAPRRGEERVVCGFSRALGVPCWRGARAAFLMRYAALVPALVPHDGRAGRIRPRAISRATTGEQPCRPAVSAVRSARGGPRGTGGQQRAAGAERDVWVRAAMRIKGARGARCRRARCRSRGSGRAERGRRSQHQPEGTRSPNSRRAARGRPCLRRTRPPTLCRASVRDSRTTTASQTPAR
jgi:hypothetical protein